MKPLPVHPYFRELERQERAAGRPCRDVLAAQSERQPEHVGDMADAVMAGLQLRHERKQEVANV